MLELKDQIVYYKAMSLLVQSLVLAASFGLIFLWENSFLFEYTVPMFGFLIAIYLILSLRKRGKDFLDFGGGYVGIFILNTLVFLIIFSTGNIESPLFFLLYFLSFGIAFAFEPPASFIFVLFSILVFLPNLIPASNVFDLIKIGSLVILSPLAYFFGSEYKREEKQEEKMESLIERTKESADTIAKEVEDVIKDEKENLKQKDMEKLDKVLEETEDLRAESSEKK